MYRLYCRGTPEHRLLQLSDRLPGGSLDAFFRQAHGRAYSPSAKVFEDVLRFGAPELVAAGAAVAAAAAAAGGGGEEGGMGGAGGDVDMAEASAAAGGGAAPAGGGEWGEGQVAALLAADPAALLEEQQQRQHAAGAAAASRGLVAVPGLEGTAAAAAASLVDLTLVSSELDDWTDEGELEQLADALAAEVGGEGGLAPRHAGALGAWAAADVEDPGRAESAAAAARYWEGLLRGAWQQLQQDEEAAARAEGREPDSLLLAEGEEEEMEEVRCCRAGLGCGLVPAGGVLRRRHQLLRAGAVYWHWEPGCSTRASLVLSLMAWGSWPIPEPTLPFLTAGASNNLWRLTSSCPAPP